MRKRNIPFFDVIYPKSDGEGGGREKQIQGRFIGRMKSEMHTDFVRVQIRKRNHLVFGEKPVRRLSYTESGE
jgi:hypothetical protein